MGKATELEGVSDLSGKDTISLSFRGEEDCHPESIREESGLQVFPACFIFTEWTECSIYATVHE